MKDSIEAHVTELFPGNNIKLVMLAPEVSENDIHTIKTLCKPDTKAIMVVDNAIQFTMNYEDKIVALMKSLNDPKLAITVFVAYANFKTSLLMNKILGHNFGLAQNQGRSLGEEFSNKRVPNELFTIFNQLKTLRNSSNNTIASYHQTIETCCKALNERLNPSSFVKFFSGVLNENQQKFYEELLGTMKQITEPF